MRIPAWPPKHAGGMLLLLLLFLPLVLTGCAATLCGKASSFPPSRGYERRSQPQHKVLIRLTDSNGCAEK
jgi:hypothetical protein